MNLEQETRYLINKYDVHAHKNLGQNFLINEDSIIAMTEDVTKNDTIIEIGPGLGTLTEVLLEKAKKVITVELDSKMCYIIKDRFKNYNNLEIINDDILNVDINKIAPSAKVVANLPYYITTSIITKLLDIDIQDIKILIQKEVADRICATPRRQRSRSNYIFSKLLCRCRNNKESKKRIFYTITKSRICNSKIKKAKKTANRSKKRRIII